MMCRRFIISIVFVLLWNSAISKIRVACVGNSVTYGYNLENQNLNSYPTILQNLLGDDYSIKNFGVPGASLSNYGDNAYSSSQEYLLSLEFSPDIVIISLGLNDLGPKVWGYARDYFVRDYLEMIESYKNTNSNIKVFIAYMSPVFSNHFLYEGYVKDRYEKIQNMIENVSKISKCEIIDFYTVLHRFPHFFEDGVHPNKSGTNILAKTVYSFITGDYGGLKMPMIYSDNMVIQRDSLFTIFGNSNYGDTIYVKIKDRDYFSITSKYGKWQVEVDPIELGPPFNIEIFSKCEYISYKNVVAGDVWLCSGQSNMFFPLEESNDIDPKDLDFDITNLRFFHLRSDIDMLGGEWDSNSLSVVNRLEFFSDSKWENCSPEIALKFSAIAYYFGKKIQRSLDVPVGIICNAIGGTPIESWISLKKLESDYTELLINNNQEYFDIDWVTETIDTNFGSNGRKNNRHPFSPGYMFDTGIEPLSIFPLKGIIWYQGESNVKNEIGYYYLLKYLIEDWRLNWKSSFLPFYIIQLPVFDQISWPWIREVQRRIADEVQKTKIIVSIDLGEPNDLHPKNKKSLGVRLANTILYDEYNFNTNRVPSGPIFNKLEFLFDTIFVRFELNDGLTTFNNDPLNSFEVAGIDQLFHPAEAIIDENTVKVFSHKVCSPKFIRYGWHPIKVGNLTNYSNIPASPFSNVPLE